MKYLYFFTLVFASINCFSQTDIIPKKLINPSFGLNGGFIGIAPTVITHDGYTYVAGTFSNTIDFDITDDSFNLSSTFGYNMFIAKYNKQYQLVFAFKLSGFSGLDYLSNLATDKDDNVYIAGSFSGTLDFDPGIGVSTLTSDSYASDLFFAKYDKNGKFIFTKKLATTSNNDPGFNALVIDSNYNIFLAGYGKPQDIDFDPGAGVVHAESHGSQDAFFAKYNSGGNLVFAKAMGSWFDDGCTSLTINKNKDIIVTGYFGDSVNDFNPNSGKVQLPFKAGIDVFIGVYDSAGNYKNAFSFGGVRNDIGYSITTDNDSNIIVSGLFFGSIDFAPDSSIVKKSSDSDYDIFLAKYKPAGKLIWVSAIRADSAGYSTVITDNNDNIFVSGNFSKTALFTSSDSLVSRGGTDAFWAKYTKRGAYSLSNQIGGANNGYLYNLSLYNNNQLSVCGYFIDTCYMNSAKTKKLVSKYYVPYLASYNLTANTVSANNFSTYRSFNPESAIIKMAHDAEGSTYITGTFQGIVDFDPGIDKYFLTSSQDANSEFEFGEYADDIFFAKYNSTGKLVFAKQISGTKGQTPASIAVDEEHNVYLAGRFEGNSDFDPGPDSVILYYKDFHHRSNFIAKYDSLGNYIFAKPIYIEGSLNAIAIDKNKNIYIAGSFSSGYFNPDNDTSEITVQGNYSYFAKYTSTGKYTYLKRIGQYNVYGNDCNDISINKKGNIVICGTVMGSKVDFDPGPNTYYVNAGNDHSLYIASYTSAGNFLFETNSMNGYANAALLKLDNNDNIVIEGYFYGNVKVDPRIDTVIKGISGATSYFIIKYNLNGYPIVIRTLNTKSYLDGNFDIESIALDNNKNIYISGSLQGKVDFDPGIDTAFLKADESMHSRNNIYLAKYDSSGNYTYAYNFAPTDTFFNRVAFSADIWINNNSDITLAANTNGKIDFYPGTDTFYYYPPFDYYPSEYDGNSFVLVKFKQTQTAKLFNIYSFEPNLKRKKYKSPLLRVQ